MQTPIVLSTVLLIFEWLVPYQNGGFLNVLSFTDNNGTLNIDFNINMDAVKNFMGIILFGKSSDFSFPVLKLMNESIGGSEKGVKEAQLNPSREMYFITVPIVCLVMIALACIGIFVLTCLCCVCCRKWQKKKRLDEDSVSEESFYYKDDDEKDKDEDRIIFCLQEKAISTDVFGAKQNRICCFCHVTATVLTAIYILSLIVMVVFYFNASGLIIDVLENSTYKEANVINWIDGKTSSMSMLNNLQFGLDSLNKFLNVSIASGKSATNITINSLDSNIKTTVPTEVGKLIDGILKGFSLTDAQNRGIDGLSALTNLSKNFEKLKSLVPTVKKDLTALKNQLESLNMLEIEDKAGLIISTNFTKLQTPSNTSIYMANKLQTTISLIIESLTGMIKTINDTRNEIIKNLLQNLDLVSQLGSLTEIWTTIEESTNVLQETFNSLVDSVKPLFITGSNYAGIVFYLPGGLMAIITLILAIYFLRFLVEAIKRKILKCSGNQASRVGQRDDFFVKSRPCGNCSFCVGAILLLVFILLFSIIGILFLVVNTIVAGELCPYIASDSGIQKTDFVINTKISPAWKKLINDTSGSLGPGVINPNPPSNLLTAIQVKCRPTNNIRSDKHGGLLTMMGLTDIINLNPLLESSTITTKLEEIKNMIVGMIVDFDLVQTLPKFPLLQNLTERLNNSIAETKYAEAAAELDGHKIPFESYKILLTQYENNTEIFEKLNAVLPNYENNMTNAIELRTIYMDIIKDTENLNNIYQLTGHLSALKTSLVNETSIGKVITPVFNSTTTTMLKDVGNFGTSLFSNFTLELFPCSPLYYSISSLLQSGCSVAGLNGRFFGWSLVMCLVLLFTFLSFVSLCNLWFFQSIQVKRFL